jgi:hypothetical protein
MSFTNKRGNIFGGNDIFVNGNFVGSSRSNILGGNNFYNDNGSFIGSTHDSITGGSHMFGATGEFHGSTNPFGDGFSIYDGEGHYSGFIASHGDMTTAFDAAGGIEAINVGGHVFGEIGLSHDELLDTLANFL